MGGRSPTPAELDALKKQYADIGAQLEKFGVVADKSTQATRSLTGSLGDFLSTGAKSTQRVHEISTAYNDMQNVLKSTTNLTTLLTQGTGNLVEQFKFLGPIASGAGAAIKGIGKAFSLVAGGAMEVPKQIIEGLDEQTRGLRQFEAEM
ncbi:MAG: hypothetical protein MK009_09880, partial [Gammaproteobacteria bacterium]|nr:hypothetical protein [Gammaproteobacteria bacterium]